MVKSCYDCKHTMVCYLIGNLAKLNKDLINQVYFQIESVAQLCKQYSPNGNIDMEKAMDKAEQKAKKQKNNQTRVEQEIEETQVIKEPEKKTEKKGKGRNALYDVEIIGQTPKALHLKNGFDLRAWIPISTVAKIVPNDPTFPKKTIYLTKNASHWLVDKIDWKTEEQEKEAQKEWALSKAL